MLSADTSSDAKTFDFGVNPGSPVRTLRVGREQHAVVVIDDLLREPRSLVEFAATRVEFRRLKQDANFYPGVRAPVPQAYLATLYRAIQPLMHETFGFPTSGPIKADCSFSLTTLPPDRLNALQRLAHFDTVDPNQLAVLHYLCDPAHGGTAFYRHRETGFEAVTDTRLATYLQTIERDLATNGPPPARYLTGSDERFEQIGSIDAKFNRVIIYRSQMLHSGNVQAGSLCDDPRTGRLTANAFFYVAAS
jgi:hypothetical protein